MPEAAPDVVTDLAPGGVLRAALNLNNPVLVQGTPAAPTGVTVDIAREIATRLGVAVKFSCFAGALDSFEAIVAGRADVCFLAVEPARAAEIAFTAPYTLIEGVYAVPVGSPLGTVADVDSAGVRIGVKLGSAYDLFLSRTLREATVVRGTEGTTAFINGSLDAAAGVREPMTEFVAAHPGYRLIPGRFMEIPQAVGIPKSRRAESARFLHQLVEELKAAGFVADSLRRSGQAVTVAPPA
ncbi:ABC transporter substrate-binding protein [Trebonia kvetii]|uniref:ABC transporter substrate-binding protein n=1 Tax=Trebonia kvetii TaxID=2480626 RepID=A0A6P2BXR0_9ACTN|nr:transporter substrate-binding domain-containing protein [Trebonia kvetii]TVZ03929.1 ABC transporter substrate-binding protein [Trebonia kvetii]